MAMSTRRLVPPAPPRQHPPPPVHPRLSAPSSNIGTHNQKIRCVGTYLERGKDSQLSYPAVVAQDDHTSDLSSESSSISSSNTTECTSSSNGSQLYSLGGFNKYQDSDNDSGIVAGSHHRGNHNGNRISSTSSNETDVSHLEGPSKSILSKSSCDGGYSSFELKPDSTNDLATGPIRGNHSILVKETTVPHHHRLSLPVDYANSNHLVRFEDDLQLSEQNVRRSCRKLFAVLYAQQNMSRLNEKPAINSLPRISETLPRRSSKLAAVNSFNNPTLLASQTGGNNSIRHGQTKHTGGGPSFKHSILDRSPSEELDIVKAYARPASVIPEDERLKATSTVIPSSRVMIVSGPQSSNRFTDVDVTVPKSIACSQCPNDTIDESNRYPIGTNWDQKSYPTFKDTRINETIPKNSGLSRNDQNQSKSLWKDRPHVNSQPCLTTINPSSSKNDELHPDNIKPKKTLHKSDFALYQGPPSSSSSRSESIELSRSRSFLDRVQGITRTARSALQRAFSQERIYRPEQEERLEAFGRVKHRSGSDFVQGIKQRVSKRVRASNGRNRKRKDENGQTVEVERVERSVINPCLWDQDTVDGSVPFDHVWGQLLQLNVDGSQVIELSRPNGKPFGFFVARGRVKNSKGVFVSRMRDQNTLKVLSGLLEVGDEILEIDGVCVKESDIQEVNEMMSKKLTLLLTVLPYICRKDI